MNHIEIINNWNLNLVFHELEQGNMRIPRFQRSYVWERAKIVKLLNSIIRTDNLKEDQQLMYDFLVAHNIDKHYTSEVIGKLLQ